MCTSALDWAREQEIKAIARQANNYRKFANDLHIAADATFGKPLKERPSKEKKAAVRMGPYLSRQQAHEAAGPGSTVRRIGWRFYGYKAGA